MEWLDWTIYGLIFILVAGVSYSTIAWLSELRRQKSDRLENLDEDEEPLVLGDLTPLLASQSPIFSAKRKVLQQELREAGYYRPTALMEYAAIRAILILVPLGVTLAVAMLSDPEYLTWIVAVGLAASVLGYSFPRVIVNMQARTRSREIERGLPMAIDLLSLGLTGGQNIFTSLKRVSRELRGAFPILAEELEIVHNQAELGSLELALQQFANRTNIQEVRTLALVLAQSERLGSDISQALFEFSGNFRTNLKQRAEGYANRASFWMLFPTIFCLWLPSIIILLGPLLKELREKVDTAKGHPELFKANVTKTLEELTGKKKK